jgi:hypothetical protein
MVFFSRTTIFCRDLHIELTLALRHEMRPADVEHPNAHLVAATDMLRKVGDKKAEQGLDKLPWRGLH